MKLKKRPWASRDKYERGNWNINLVNAKWNLIWKLNVKNMVFNHMYLYCIKRLHVLYLHVIAKTFRCRIGDIKIKYPLHFILRIIITFSNMEARIQLCLFIKNIPCTMAHYSLKVVTFKIFYSEKSQDWWETLGEV